MLLAFKIKLNLTKDQQSTINSMSSEGRMLYNHFLSRLRECYTSTGKFISYYEQQRELKNYICTYLTFDAKKEILRTLHNNYSSFFKLAKDNKGLNPKPPRFRGKDFFFTLSFTQDFIIKENLLKISHQYGKRVEVSLEYTYPIENLTCFGRKTAASDIKQLKIYKQKNLYFASIIYEKREALKKPVNYEEILSIDLGKKNLLSVYDVASNIGTVYSSKHLSKNQKHLDRRCDELRSLRDTKSKKSKKYNILDKKLDSIFSKKRTQTNLALQKISKDISNQNKTIIIGELSNIKRNIISQHRGINRQMQNNWNLQTFMHLLEYKCALIGNQVVKVNEAWTSKTCCKCGEINSDLTLSDRQYICDCGNNINRDINGAINIYKHFMGDYNPPLDIDKTLVSERFGWCHTNQMNRSHHFCY